MSEVKNNENSVAGEPSYPAGYTNPWRDDEIDLVDLWIVMWSYRKLFLSSVILVAVIGIVCFELVYKVNPTFTVRSVIEIESIIYEGRRIQVVDPDVLVKRIEFIMLPRFSSLSEFEQIKSLIMATRVFPIKKNSDIVEIVTKVPAGEIANSSRFHGQLVDEVLLDLEKPAELAKTGVHDSLFSAKSRIVSLERSIIALEQDLLEETNSQGASNRSLQAEITLRKANIQSEIDILKERIKYFELTLSNTGSLVLLKAGVSGISPRYTKLTAYAMILILSLLLALFLTIGVIFARKVKDRMAAAE